MRLLDTLSSGSVYLKDLLISVAPVWVFSILLCAVLRNAKERGQEFLQKERCPVTPEGLRTYVFVWK